MLTFLILAVLASSGILFVLAVSPWLVADGARGYGLPWSCVLRGHMWHEGEDTLHILVGDRHGGFYWGGYTWRCLRCGTRTEPGEATPVDLSWDPDWCTPDPTRGNNRSCVRTYRQESGLDPTRWSGSG